ncbi:hypothetical protein JW960_27720 [candidate division KSB1 bacterium]|nr:hypothetical protein [candidate division KSB1 bacterium]
MRELEGIIFKNGSYPARLHRFVLALTFFRHPCYLSVLHSWPFIKSPKSFSIAHDNDELRYYEAKVYLEVLRRCHAIRDDEGQFTYMHHSTALIFQAYLRVQLGDDYDYLSAECHQGIADWYMKQYRASGDVIAAYESIYHRFKCIESALEIKLDDILNKKRFMDTSVLEIILSLELTKSNVLSSFHTYTMMHLFKNFIDRVDLQQPDSVSVSAKMKNLQKNGEYEWHIGQLAKIRKSLAKIQNKYYHQIGNYPCPAETGKVHELQQERSSSDIISRHTRLEIDISPINKKWEAIKHFINIRYYDDAHKLINEILTELSIQEELILSGNTILIRESALEWIYYWIHEVNTSKIGMKDALSVCQPMFRFVVQLCRRFQLLMLYFAQIEHYLKESTPTHRSRETEYYIKAEKIYIFSTEIMHYILDSNFLNHENGLLRTNTGILLSRMMRHNEAYRRYNEAYSYLNIAADSDSPYGYSIIDLRRGETFLSQIEQNLYTRDADKNGNHSGNSQPITRCDKIQIGMLFDAIASVDRAESRMKGISVNTWWYCWMYEMQLNICLQIMMLREKIMSKIFPTRTEAGKMDKYDLFARCRECEYCGKRFQSNFAKGMQIVSDDMLRLSRYLKFANDYFSVIKKQPCAASAITITDFYDNIRYCRTRLQELFESYDGCNQGVQDYAKKIAEIIDTRIHNL